MSTTTRTDLHWLRLSLVFVWLWTAAATVWEWNGQSMAMLVALPDAWPRLKPALVAGGATVDALLGLWLWGRPGRWAYGVALMTMVLMTALATAIEPSLWLHPLGPLSKNLPIAAALLLLWRQDARA